VTAGLRADGKLAGERILATVTAPPADVTVGVGAVYVYVSAAATNGTIFDVDTVTLTAE
jgi:hypothetical protein